MKGLLDITTDGDLTEQPGDKPIKDALTGYPVQLWEQKTLIPGKRVFIVLYYRNGHWRKGSAQLLDRTLRAFGLGGLTNVPWGPGQEMAFAIDDMIDRAGGPVGMSPAAGLLGHQEG